MVRKVFIYQAIIIFLFFIAPKAFSLTIEDAVNANAEFAPAILAISVKDADNGAVLYQKNPKTLVHPASTLKIITSSAAYDYLGQDYNFKTAIYKTGNRVYLKVGADPLFAYSDMLNLVSQFKTKNQDAVKNFYVDDTIIDKVPFGAGWQWDDNASVYFPQISPYTINSNLFMVKANLSSRNEVVVEYAKEYKETIVNNLKYGSKRNITRERDIFSEDAKVYLSGTINDTTIIEIPAKNPKQLYDNVLLFAFLSNNIPININFRYEKLPYFCAQEAIITHSIDDVLKRINQNSDNLSAEILLKHAGAVKVDGTGTTKNGLSVVYDFYAKNAVDMKDVILVDASGASMNDYITTDFITEALRAIRKNQNFNAIKSSMADGSVGTFKGRLPELNGKLKVKTGTNANTSAVTGYIQSKSGRNLVFAIVLDNLPKNVNSKAFEDTIIKAIYQL